MWLLGYAYGCCPHDFQLPTLPVTYTTNTVLSNLLLKLEVFSLLEISGHKEFHFVSVHGKKLYLNTLELTAGGMKW